MTAGRQPQIEQEVDWVTDEDNNLLGYQRKPGDIERLVSAQPPRHGAAVPPWELCRNW